MVSSKYHAAINAPGAAVSAVAPVVFVATKFMVVGCSYSAGQYHHRHHRLYRRQIAGWTGR